jgi:putative spermidine/putrescine transport system permease protein
MTVPSSRLGSVAGSIFDPTGRWIPAGRLRHVATGTLLACPLMIFLGAAFYYPLAYTTVQSVTPTHGSGWTLAHYSAFLGSRAGLGVLALTLGLSLAATVLSILLSLPLALLLRRQFAGRRALQFLMMLPITIPALVGALGLVILYDRTGWINVVLLRMHVLTRPIYIDYTIPGLVLFYVWMFFPYGGLVIMSGLGAIDPALEEAGLVMGASPMGVFRRVLLPLLSSSLWAGAVMIFLQCFGAFSIPLIAGGNYQPIGVKIYTVANVFLDWHQASAMAVVMGVIQATLVIAYQSIARTRRPT